MTAAASALHWLSKPVPTKEHIFPDMNPKTAALTAELAAADWLQFLRLWKIQAVSNGYLVAILLSADNDKATSSHWRNAVDETWKSMARDGIISKSELEAMNVPSKEPPLDALSQLQGRSLHCS